MFNDVAYKRAIEFLREASNDPRLLRPVFSSKSRTAHFFAFITWADISGKLNKEDRAMAMRFLSTDNAIVSIRDTVAFDASLAVASNGVANGLSDGTECGVCGQNAREYRRKLNSNMAIFLKSLVRAHYISVASGGDGWIHHSELEYTGRDYTMLAHWGLAKTQREEADENGNKQKKTSGSWYPTHEGIDFVRGKLAVRKYIYMYNGICRFDEKDPRTTFGNALGERFSFSELFTGVTDGE